LNLDQEFLAQQIWNTVVKPFSLMYCYIYTLSCKLSYLGTAVCSEPIRVAHTLPICFLTANTITIALIHSITHFRRKI